MDRIMKDDYVIVLAGGAGQGIQAIESILTSLLKKSGYHLYATKEYMSRVRGGVNSTSIRVSSSKVTAYTERIDLLIPLVGDAISHLSGRISHDTIIIGDKSVLGGDRTVDIPFAAIASELGNAVYANTVAVGVICGLFGLDAKLCGEFITGYFAGKAENVRDGNLNALKRGYADGERLHTTVGIEIKPDDNVHGEIVLSGSEAVAMGAVAGGCDYVCGYPMSPSTGVLERMAEYSKRFDIIVEQVEDEVGVINMALGAWYAGARAMVTTSGGGFALMSEGLSLCGMIESPLVIHLAQRPGPATGLPTRTEQGDLNLALYAGHGDFPRIILAPGTLEEGYSCTRRAFDLADKYQIPVFILTDQYFVDTYYNTPIFEIPADPPRKHIVKNDAGYKRFAFTENGISPRSVPGFGGGIVCVDSDEHDEGGYIIEDAETRVKMVDKRLRKFKAFNAEIIQPTRIGGKDNKTVIVCWGSTFHMVTEACERIGSDDITVLHFSWIFPLPDTIADELRRARTVIAIENNATGQFSDLIKLTTGFDITRRILKYDGHPFSVEEIGDGISGMLKAGTK
jgi:2-oxoglutarate ferredoxin oxidoreductase subunit alpha